MKTYNVGIIGFGMIGKVHAYCYRALPFCCDFVAEGGSAGDAHSSPIGDDGLPLQVRITHVVTSRLETAETARNLIGADVAATDYRTVTENPQIDIVHICTPNHLHKEALLSAIAHGKHIYCDKPLVATAAEADEIEAVLPGYRGTAQMTFQNRFFPATMRMKQLIDEGVLGNVLGFRACYLHGGNANPATPLRWRLSAAAGGGVIADLGSHVLDLLDWLIGPFHSVTAATHIAYPERPSVDDPAQMLPVDVEDCALLLAKMRSGALGTIEATKIATGAEDEIRLEIHGSRGALRFNEMDPHHLEFHDATVSDQPLGGMRGWNRIDAGHRYPARGTTFPNPKAAIGWDRSHVACLGNFLQAVAEGRPAEPGLRQGIRVQRLMDCVRRSAAQKNWVEV